jgi:membrane-associated phospholipid phosphatase
MSTTPTRHHHRFPPDLLRPSHVLLWSPALFVISLAVTVVVAVLASVAPQVLLAIDRPVSAFLHDEDWVPFFRVVTEVGRPWAVALLSVIAGALLWRRCRLFALALPATALSAVVVNVLLKLLISRVRPPFGIGASEGPTSFPSGHVVLGVIGLGLLVPVVYVVTGRRWLYHAALALFVVYVPVVGLSRIVLGAHWFTDVIGSFFIGATFLLGAEYLVGSRLADDHCTCRLHDGGRAEP